MSVLLLKFAPWIAGFLVIFGAGTWTGYKAAGPRYNKLQSQYEAFQLTVAHNAEASQKAAAKALQAQIDDRNATEARNAQLQDSLRTLSDRAAAAQRSALFAQRLLAAAQARPKPGSGAVPAPEGGRQSDDPAQARGDRPAADLFGLTRDSATECRDAIQNYAGLQLELAPQLKVQP